jgi:hypothetical protein
MVRIRDANRTAAESPGRLATAGRPVSRSWFEDPVSLERHWQTNACGRIDATALDSARRDRPTIW